MSKPRVYVHRAGPWYPLFMDAANEAALSRFADVITERGLDATVPPNAMRERLRGCSAILSLNGFGAEDLTAEILRAAGDLRVICVAHYWGQFDDLTVPGVCVVEGSNTGTVAVAEWILAAALMGTRRLHVFDRALKQGSPWGEPRRSMGMLAGSRAGLIGLGRIGRYVARLFRALGIEARAYSRSCPPELASELGVTLVPLDELIAFADVLSLQLRLTEGTRGLLGRRELSLIKPGCVLINAARAGLYDEAALVAELRRGHFTAYLDVFATEPLPLDHPLRSLPNVVLTPHIAGNNAVMFRRAARDAIQTLEDFFAGKGLQDRRYRYP